MIFIAACHAALATSTPQDKQTPFSTRHKDKGKTTEMSSVGIQTSSSQ
jgi:hypothetical protein